MGGGLLIRFSIQHWIFINKLVQSNVIVVSSTLASHWGEKSSGELLSLRKIVHENAQADQHGYCLGVLFELWQQSSAFVLYIHMCTYAWEGTGNSAYLIRHTNVVHGDMQLLEW